MKRSFFDGLSALCLGLLFATVSFAQTAAHPLPEMVVLPVETIQPYEPVMFFHHDIYFPARSIQSRVENFARQAEVNNWQWVDTLYGGKPGVEEYFPCAVRHFDLSPRLDAWGELYYQVAETMPRFPGRPFAVIDTLAELVRPFAETQPDTLVPNVAWVHFIVEPDGSLSNIRPYRLREMAGDQPSYNDFREAAARAVVALPRWEPARHYGEPVRCAMVVQVRFGWKNQRGG